MDLGGNQMRMHRTTRGRSGRRVLTTAFCSLLIFAKTKQFEPFLTTRATTAVTAPDGWTLRTPDGSRGAQFEHTMIITRDRPIVLTAN